MTVATPKCLLCTCGKTMSFDTVKSGERNDLASVSNELCRAQLSRFEEALGLGGPLLVGCTQEAPLFAEIAEEAGRSDVTFVNIRETAGWSQDATHAGPKIEALLAGASYRAAPARLKTINSDGSCLVYGKGQQAYDLARHLSSHLSVTLVLRDVDDFLPPVTADVPVFRGRVRSVTGSFGGFRVTFADHAALRPSSRDVPRFVPQSLPPDTQYSLIVDVSGGRPLVSGEAHRDGYFRVDPARPAAVMEAVLQAVDMVGEFEKPIYVSYDAPVCAHSRSKIAGCSKCLDACPASAISEDGDGVSIDPLICGGCGSCAAVCPTGAITYRYPARVDLVGRVQLMIRRYYDAGGEDAVLLLYPEGFGDELIAMMARFGRGLPANVIPQPLHAATSLGHVEMAALLASGVGRIVCLTDPALGAEIEPLQYETDLANRICTGLGQGQDKVVLVEDADPEKIEELLWSAPKPASAVRSFVNAAGAKRETARLAFSALNVAGVERVDSLPANAPYGRVNIDTSACTLCMSCVSACPASAMMDTPGVPTLRFTEAACVQCGLCVATCPEDALSLEPQLNLSPDAMRPETLKEDEPFACISCGEEFAPRSTIERIRSKLAGQHSMFATADRARLIEMCDTCRVKAQAEGGDDPFSYRAKPLTRTTEDDLRERDAALSPKDFVIDD
ncbi:4Fe-4S binding protein [Qingshengfaniella alkalisoli]|uniref:4Fe-4S dicluster domain-containing protein n=1 Tax=Qingshengfaniella alkalisoli TaxID=2599296 RepID=A0A5B8J5N1_9RHOB|nr:4Fe-4S binding protein [Qingshengfaniella alkalisoli]QDY69797.1 4Fe-4S dicluster domain-containing protein [Qingshengfaniella alkalisoli]